MATACFSLEVYGRLLAAGKEVRRGTEGKRRDGREEGCRKSRTDEGQTRDRTASCLVAQRQLTRLRITFAQVPGPLWRCSRFIVEENSTPLRPSYLLLFQSIQASRCEITQTSLPSSQSSMFRATRMQADGLLPNKRMPMQGTPSKHLLQHSDLLARLCQCESHDQADWSRIRSRKELAVVLQLYSLDSCLCLHSTTISLLPPVQPIARLPFVLTLPLQTRIFSSPYDHRHYLPLSCSAAIRCSPPKTTDSRSPFRRPPPTKSSRSLPMTHRHTLHHSLRTSASRLPCPLAIRTN
jgi:hypothetical protein